MHFTVLVTGENIGEQLAPFQENNMGDCPKQYLEFFNVEDEYRSEYETGSSTMVVMSDGRLVSQYAVQFYERGELGTRFHKIPENLEQREIPHTERYPTFGEFLESCHGYEKDKETGKYGYWENPNAKWDWYQLGGRWSGFLQIKPNPVGEVYLGDKSLTFPRRTEKGEADSALKKDIDFQKMRMQAKVKAHEAYDEFEAAIEKHNVTDFGVSREQFDKMHSGLGNKELRELWFNIPLNRALSNERIWTTDPVEEFFIFTGGREAFVQHAIDTSFVLYAFLHEGKWYEKSFGKNEKVWDSNFMLLIDALPDDTRLSVVDCHI